MKNMTVVFLILFLGAFVSTAESNPISENNTRIPLLTRSVKIFTELEAGLIGALKNNNQDKLKQLLADDFEMRLALEPANPVPYSDWLQNSLFEASNYSTNSEQMSVHELDKTAVVNFLWLPVADTKFFVVDVWRQQGANWKLTVRYISSATDSAGKIPGFVDKETVIRKKY